jgi:hypothetical protein
MATITRPVLTAKAVVPPGIRWPDKRRLSEEEKAAIDEYTRSVETTVRALRDMVDELQTLVAKGIP